MDNLLDPLDYIQTFDSGVFSTFLDTYPQGIIFLDEDGRIRYANQAMQSMVCKETLHGRHFDSLLSSGGRENTLSALFHNTSTQASGLKSEVVLNLSDGKELPVEINFNLLDDQGKKLIFCVISDISERTILQEQLLKQAITDPLTGIFNRRHFDERLAKEFKRSSRYNRTFSTIIIDIDSFKQANDLFGHGFGDEMLIAATNVFKSILRDDDSVYRYGGDEFAMLLPETSKEGAIEVSERLKEGFAKFVSGIEKRIKLSLSVGVASYPEDGVDEKLLIGMADKRMYQSKGRGGNMVTARDHMDYLKTDTDRLLHSLSNLAQLMEKQRAVISAESHNNHSQDIRALVVTLGNEIGLSKKQMSQLQQAAMLHDIGTIYIPASILNKKGALTSDEWSDVKRHTLIGEDIIASIAANGETELQDIKEIIGQHHEKLDGSGYPRGLVGEDIRFEAQILAVSDTYTALRSARPYREAFSKEAALDEVLRLSGTHFSPKVVEHLVNLETRH